MYGPIAAAASKKQKHLWSSDLTPTHISLSLSLSHTHAHTHTHLVYVSIYLSFPHCVLAFPLYCFIKLSLPAMSALADCYSLNSNIFNTFQNYHCFNPLFSWRMLKGPNLKFSILHILVVKGKFWSYVDNISPKLKKRSLVILGL